MKAAFGEFDRNGDGVLSMLEVTAALKRLQLSPPMSLLRQFAKADGDADGSLQFAEFCALVAELQRQSGVGAARVGRRGGRGVARRRRRRRRRRRSCWKRSAIFAMHDRDQSGYINTRELKRALNALNLDADTQQVTPPPTPPPTLPPSPPHPLTLPHPSSLPPQARAILSRFDANHDHKLDLQEFTELVRRVRHEQAAAAHPAAGSLPALRAAFGSYVVHGDHSDRVAVTDLRSALLRAGVDANSRVALAAFAELQRTGRTHVDFDAFLRVANAVAAHSDSRGAPKPTVPPSPPGAAPPPTGAPPSAAWSTWSEIPDDPYAVRPAALVGGGSAAATAAAAPPPPRRRRTRRPRTRRSPPTPRRPPPSPPTAAPPPPRRSRRRRRRSPRRRRRPVMGIRSRRGSARRRRLAAAARRRER